MFSRYIHCVKYILVLISWRKFLLHELLNLLTIDEQVPCHLGLETQINTVFTQACTVLVNQYCDNVFFFEK